MALTPVPSQSGVRPIDSPASKVTSRGHAIAAATLGTSLESADISMYAFMAPMIAHTFFPADDPNVSLLIAFATYGSTFLVRPLGAMFFGIYADTIGRRNTLSIILALMGLGSVLIGLMPGYTTIGVLAAVGVVFARLLQGFSVGGQQGSAVSYVIEREPHRRGENIGWVSASGGLGQMLAAGISAALSYFLTTEQVMSWGWRLPFLLGGLIYPVGLYIRRSTDESEEFVNTRKDRHPLRTVFVLHWRQFSLAGMLIGTMTVTLYLGMYLPGYATARLGLSAAPALLSTVLSGTIILIATPLFGRLSDRIGRLPVLLPGLIGLVLTPWPMMVWLAAAPSLARLMTLQVVLAVFFSAYTPSVMTIIARVFPTNIRASGISVANAIGTGIIGGFAFFIFALIASLFSNPAAPSLYLVAVAGGSLLSLRPFLRYISRSGD